MRLMNFSYGLVDMPSLVADDYVSLPQPGVNAIEFVPLPIAVGAVLPATEHVDVVHEPGWPHAPELVGIVEETPEPNAVELVAMAEPEFGVQALRHVEQQRDVERCAVREQRRRAVGRCVVPEERQRDAMERIEIIGPVLKLIKRHGQPQRMLTWATGMARRLSVTTAACPLGPSKYARIFSKSFNA